MPIGPGELAILMIVCVGSLLVIGVILFVIRLIVTSNAQPKQQSPLEILQERYARGEITAEEYEERRKHLQDTSE